MRRIDPHMAALVLSFFSVAAWSSAIVGIGLALRDVQPGPLVFLRFCVASLCFLAMMISGKVKLPDRRDLPLLFVLGALGHAVYQLALSFAQTKISAGMAGVVISLIPVFTALLATAFLRETLSARGWVGMTIAFAGVVLIAMRGGETVSFNPWVLVAVTSALASAGYFILQKPLLNRYSALDITAYGIWAGTLIMAFFAFQAHAALPSISPVSLLAVIYLGIVPTAIGYSLWSMALARASASQVSSMLYLEPAITFFLAWIVLGEIPTLNSLIGAALALLGVFLVTGKRR